MTDTKKKKPASKSTSKSTSKPAGKKAAPDDAAILDAVLARALDHAATDGFTDAALAKAGKEEGADQDTLARLFPDGGLSVIAEFSRVTDAEMEKRLAALDLPSRKMRERIRLAVRTRLDILTPRKDAARRAVATLTLPAHAGLGARLLYRSVDAMWRAAGDTSTDFNFYTKRGILAGVYSATLMRWFNDAGENETDAFLAARIENVMQFEKFKAGVKKGLEGLPSFGEMLRGAKKD